MATRNPTLIAALRETADRIASGARYEWGHMGRCNCGHLVQTVTQLTDREIVRSIDHKLEEWTEHANDYCSGTGHKVDALFEALGDIGFDADDVCHLEYLSDPLVLSRLPENDRSLRRNQPEDVCLYLRTFADALEAVPV